MHRNIALIPATEQHFDAILRLERDAGRSLVVLTEGHALREAHERGHEIVVATIDGAIVGWIWYARSLERGAEEIGQIYRVAVALNARRTGVGRALVSHAVDSLASKGCRRVRTSVDGVDDGARWLFEDAEFGVDAITMEREL